MPFKSFRVSKILYFAINSNTARRYKDASDTQRYKVMYRLIWLILFMDMTFSTSA